MRELRVGVPLLLASILFAFSSRQKLQGRSNTSKVQRGRSVEELSCPDVYRNIEKCRNNSELNTLDQQDPKLIKIVKRCFVFSPPENGKTLEKRTVEMNGREGQPTIIDSLYRYKMNGFFVEVGAHDGLFSTNTLFFEQERNWRGLLIEADKTKFNALKELGRNAYIVNTCIGTLKTPAMSLFDGEGIPQDDNILPRDLYYHQEGYKPLHDVNNLTCTQCLPLYSILASIGNPVIDLFSLDVEGAEYPILQNFPFEKVDIKIFLIETKHIGQVFKEGSKKQMVRLMKRHGYRKLNIPFELDSIFVKAGVIIDKVALKKFTIPKHNKYEKEPILTVSKKQQR